MVMRVMFAALALLGVTIALSWIGGRALSAPVRRTIGPVPADIPGAQVEFGSQSGATLRGWYVRGERGAGIIVIMHGVRASRVDMLDRARFLRRAGHGVLLFDFQAHGESTGERITFGYLESRDAQAAIAFARSSAPDERVGALGVSLGGAAIILSHPPLAVDAAVLEQVYPTIEEAVANRIALRLGGWSRYLSPLLVWQLYPTLGVSGAALRPVERVSRIQCHKMFIAGGRDQHTTLSQSEALFAAAGSPKDLWVLPEARHVDLHRFGKEQYEARVGRFFSGTLRKEPE